MALPFGFAKGPMTLGRVEWVTTSPSLITTTTSKRTEKALRGRMLFSMPTTTNGVDPAMPASRNRRRRLSCGHKGFGLPCHRCQQADKLNAKAEALPKDKTEARRAMFEEAARLKSLDGKVPVNLPGRPVPGEPGVLRFGA